MLGCARRLILIIGAMVAAGSSASAQYIPPHSNDPHPPANPPPYMRNPGAVLPRPGVPLYPGAPHSNDPHYTKVQPRIEWPKATYPETDRPIIRRYPGSASPAPIVEGEGARRGKTRKAPSKTSEDRSISLSQCMRNWDPGTRMSRSAWDTTCRRLAVDGRVRIR